MRLHRIIENTRAEGPGQRFTLWVQGCRNGCPGCYSRALWPRDGGFEMTVSQLLEKIKATPGIEGVTFLGGEPMEQAEQLADLAEGVGKLGLSVLTFTGLVYEALLREADPHRLRLIHATDLLIDGPYLQEQQDFSRPWVGSKNQRYLFLTDRYCPSDVENCRNRVEFRVDKSGVLRLNGMGDFAALEKILESKTIVRGKEDGLHEF